MHFIIIILTLCFLSDPSYSTIISQPLKPPNFPTPNIVPSFPVQSGTGKACELDLSAELFGGVKTACTTHPLDRSRCCPVLAAWMYAAHARTALNVHIIANTSISSSTTTYPMIPDDSQKCVSSLQTSLQSRNIHIPRLNASCDAIICFCGIRLHQIGSLSCPDAFNVSAASRNATPTAVVKDLEKNCRNSSYAGCTKCLNALHKLNGEGKNGTTKNDRMSKMLTRDCQLMGLTWLLAKNKTAYIPTVSAILRAIMYNAHQQPPPHDSFTCSRDQENMPLAVDSLQFDKSESASSSSDMSLFSCLSYVVVFLMTILPLLVYM